MHTRTKKHFYPLRWAVALGAVSDSIQRLTQSPPRWTEAHSQGLSKDPTVPTWVLQKRPRPPSLGKLRLSPSLSGHFRAPRMTTIRPPATLPATLPPSPPLLPFPPRLSPCCDNLSHPLPVPSRSPQSLSGKLRISTRISKRTPSVCGAGAVSFEALTWELWGL